MAEAKTWTRDEIEQIVISTMNDVGASIEGSDGIEEIIDAASLTDNEVSLPGVRLDSNGNPLNYVWARLSIFADLVSSAKNTIVNQWNAWFGTSVATGVQNAWHTWFGDAPTEQSPGSGVQKEWAGIKADAVDAVSAANSATSAAQAVTAGAAKVNAQLSGMTVSVTDRNGQTTSVNIGFEIYRTYGSVAAMNADAASVPAGKFVIIATTDPTDSENARLYSKNSSGGFSFLSDLDQASSAAWADWLNNMKPVIQSAISDANAAASLANTKAGLANNAADNANSKAQAAQDAADAANAAIESLPSEATEEAVRNIVRDWTPTE